MQLTKHQRILERIVAREHDVGYETKNEDLVSREEDVDAVISDRLSSICSLTKPQLYSH